MTIEHLEAELGSVEIASEPDRWAFAAYRLALAKSETARHDDDVRDALRLLDKSARILTPARSPVEHARVITAAANCHRQLGRSERAVGLFDAAVRLLDGRVPGPELAASLVNQGLASAEVGRPADAIEPLGRALALVDSADDGEARRVRAAARINRAQALQAMADQASLCGAIEDYAEAMADLDDGAPQRGIAAHGLGTAILELVARGDARWTIDDAIGAFHSSALILTVNAFPFQHAMVQHSLAVAYERRASPFDLQRAMARVEIALWIFDPRLHAAQWRTAADTLDRLEQRLRADGAEGTRADHLVALLVAADEIERRSLLRERLLLASRAGGERLRRDVTGLADAVTAISPDEYEAVLCSMLPVLMELPEAVLDSTCAALCAAHRESGRQEVFDERLDRVVHDLLFGPQRVRVRDILEANGWVRP